MANRAVLTPPDPTPPAALDYHAGVVWGIRHPGPGPIGCTYCIATLQQPVPAGSGT